MRNGPDDFAARRRDMVARQLAARGIADERVLGAMGRVPREAFVPEDLRHRAYDDGALPIGGGQTISQPYIVALMIESLELGGGERVLEVGAGSGYAAAVLAEIAGEVIAIERDAALAARARGTLKRLGRDRVEIVEGDGSLGFPARAPYDGILVSAGAPDVPQPLVEQLAPGGRLVVPVGRTRTLQRIVRIRKDASGKTAREPLGDVRFVPLCGVHGWGD